jgi:glutathione synthase/RimK-type ligase-like ATP-grasp enzyme
MNRTKTAPAAAKSTDTGVYRVFVGTRQSDILVYGDFFSESILYYGTESGDCAVYEKSQRTSADYHVPFVSFVVSNMNRIIASHPNCKFHFYANKLAYKIHEADSSLGKYFACINDSATVNMLDDKIAARRYFTGIVPTTPYWVLPKEKCGYRSLCDEFGTGLFVVQGSVSSGGEETFLLSGDSEGHIMPLLKHGCDYIVSSYYETSSSASCHIIVYDDRVVVIRPNIQRTFDTADTVYRIIHRGNDYVAGASALSDAAKRRMYSTSKIIGEKLREMGYRGVCGIDYLVMGDELMMLEINPRFLGSSFLVDRSLKDNGLPSLWELNISAFSHGSIDEDFVQTLESAPITYGSLTYSYFKDFTPAEIARFFEASERNGSVYLDGFNFTQECEHDAYLFRSMHSGTPEKMISIYR